MPPNDATTQENKKFRSTLKSIEDDWKCPITLRLPLDPVIAEDGRTYERSAIEEHIRVRGADLRSPISNMPMGPRLMANPQARSTIEHLVHTGVLGGDKMERWLAQARPRHPRRSRRRPTAPAPRREQSE